MTNLTKIISSSAFLVALAATALAADAEPNGKSVCLTRNAEAAMTSKIPAELPLLASIGGFSGSASIKLDIDERGAAHNAVVATSSGYAILDAAAVKAALAQAYTPRIRDCANVGGSYLVDVEFSPNAG
jgi:TonB family protein